MTQSQSQQQTATRNPAIPLVIAVLLVSFAVKGFLVLNEKQEAALTQDEAPPVQSAPTTDSAPSETVALDDEPDDGAGDRVATKEEATPATQEAAKTTDSAPSETVALDDEPDDGATARATTKEESTPAAQGAAETTDSSDFIKNIIEKANRREPDEPWEDSPSREPGFRQTLTIEGIEYAFRWIPAGAFTMGSPKTEEGRADDEPQHEVEIERGFWMLETEVTQEMFKSIKGYNVGQYKDKPRFPAVNVTWDICQDFAKELTLREECPEGFEFRLPTEEEWEYACRAGTTTAFSFGDSSNGDGFMNCRDSPPYNSPALVGKYPANPWGLYDMHGNAEEWTTSTKYHEFRGSLKYTNDEPGMYLYVIRGGGWKSAVKYCRAAYRNGAGSVFLSEELGFRLVLSKIDDENETP